MGQDEANSAEEFLPWNFIVLQRYIFRFRSAHVQISLIATCKAEEGRF